MNKFAAGLLFTVGFVVIMGLLIGFPLKWVWNAIMPELFGFKLITFWQAVGLYFLGHSIFGSNQTASSSKKD